MVDSILTNQAPVAQKPAENRSDTSIAVSNASSVPEVEIAEETVDVTPRAMDIDANQAFSERGLPQLSEPVAEVMKTDIVLRPSLENFGPRELTTEKALENRVADLEVRPNDRIDETDSQLTVNNGAIEAFKSPDAIMQQAVDLSA